jgi:hypothetical protein
MIYLKPYGHRKGDLVRGSQGCCIHLPIPIQGTINHTLNTLPSTDRLRIVVEAQTKNLKIHRKVVDVPKVVIRDHTITIFILILAPGLLFFDPALEGASIKDGASISRSLE